MITTKNNPVLIIVRGLPGSGKTYFAEKLVENLGNINTVLLDPDSTDYESEEYKKHVEQQVIEGVDPKLHAYRFLRAKAYKAIEDNNIIIWNQPFTNLEILQKAINRLLDKAREVNKQLPVYIVEVEIDPELAYERVNSRKALGMHGPSKSRFEQFVKEYTTSSSLGYRIITIKGDEDNTKNVNLVIEEIKSLNN